MRFCNCMLLAAALFALVGLAGCNSGAGGGTVKSEGPPPSGASVARPGTVAPSGGGGGGQSLSQGPTTGARVPSKAD
jgi:hypothetical protein